MKRVKKEIEYEDSPSGYVTLYNYKEPFMEFEKGFGYQGVLLFDGETDKVQCHFCGEWFDYLPAHIPIHGLHASEYKKEVGLRQTSALISESHREKLVKDRKKSIKNLRKGKKKNDKTKNKISKTLKENSLLRETQNEKGTCPYQLIDRLQKLAKKLNRTPGQRDCSFYPTVSKVFGSWQKGIEMADLKVRKPGQIIRKNRVNYSKESLTEILKNFYKINNRLPSQSDLARNMLPSEETFKRHFGSWKKALAIIK